VEVATSYGVDQAEREWVKGKQSTRQGHRAGLPNQRLGGTYLKQSRESSMVAR